MTKNDFIELLNSHTFYRACRILIASGETDELVTLKTYTEMIKEQIDLGNYEIYECLKALDECKERFGFREGDDVILHQFVGDDDYTLHVMSTVEDLEEFEIFDYEDEYDDSYDELGYNPYMGCCDYDC